MTDVIDVDVTSSSMVPAQSPPQSSLISLAAPIEQIVLAQRAYHQVCTELLDENDIQVIGQKQFKKRSAWNKLAVAFAVSTEEVRTSHERDERGRIIRTECVVRATAPNGRVSDGIGACDLYERCCDPDTCTRWTEYPDSGKPTGHVHCSYPCKQAHFSNPQHDIPATAFTRASNRAKADLFGMGEVSAEEITGDGGGTWDDGQQGSGGGGGGPSGGQERKISEGQVKLIHAVSNKLNYGAARDAVKKFAGFEADPETLTMTQARAVIDALKKEEAGEAVPAVPPIHPPTGQEPPQADPAAEEAMHGLGELIKDLATEDQEVVKSHLRGRFGESRLMNLEQIQLATAVVAGWPDTAKPSQLEGPQEGAPF